MLNLIFMKIVFRNEVKIKAFSEDEKQNLLPSDVPFKNG